MAWAMLPGLMSLTRIECSGGMETGIELVVRVLVGGAAIRPSVGRPHHVLLPESGFSDQCADDLVEGVPAENLIRAAHAACWYS
jgi:hypothetical protein